MSEWLRIEQIDEATRTITRLIKIQPKVGLILGSGLGNLAELVEEAVTIPYKEIPNWPLSTISGRLHSNFLAEHGIRATVTMSLGSMPVS